MDGTLGESLRAPSPFKGPNSADLPAVPPVPHERHLPVAAPAHDPQVAVGCQGHVPGAGPQSECGGGGGQGSTAQRNAPLMPERLRCPRLRRQPGPGANARAEPTATPLPWRSQPARPRACSGGLGGSAAPRYQGGSAVPGGPTIELRRPERLRRSLRASCASAPSAGNFRVAGDYKAKEAASGVLVLNVLRVFFIHAGSMYCPSTMCQAGKVPAFLELTF